MSASDSIELSENRGWPQSYDERLFKDLSESELADRVEELFHLLRGPNTDEQVLTLRMLMRGALLAQRPSNLHEPPHIEDNVSISGAADSEQGTPSTGADGLHRRASLTAEERIRTKREHGAIMREDRGKLSSIPKDLWIILLTCAVGAIVQGWAQENIVGANLQWPTDLGIATVNATDQACSSLEFREDSPNIFGLINAIPYFAAGVLGPLVSDPIADIFGRRTALSVSAIFSLASPIGAAFSQNWRQLLVCRLLQGIGMGAKSSIIPVVESEVSPPKMRAQLMVSWQTSVATGLFIGAVVDYVFLSSWRLQIGLSMASALVLLFLCYVIPETPHWHVKNHEFVKALAVLLRIRETQVQAARDLYQLYEQSKTSLALSPEISPAGDESSQPECIGSRLGECFETLDAYYRLFGEINRQLSGFNLLAFLSTTVIHRACIGDQQNLHFTLAFTAANVIASAATFFMIKSVGRRGLLLTSLTLMFPLLVATGSLLQTNGDHQQNQGPIIFCILLYTVTYSFGAGVIPFMYSSEVFPLPSRETGMASACAVNFVLAGTLAIGVAGKLAQGPDGVTEFNILGVFAGLDAIAIVLVWLLMRSQGDKTPLEDMDELFDGALHEYPLYQLWEAKRLLRILQESALGGNQSDSPSDLTFKTFPEWRSKRPRERREPQTQEVLTEEATG